MATSKKVRKDSTTGKFVSKKELASNPKGTFEQKIVPKERAYHYVYVNTETGRLVSKQFAKENPSITAKKKAANPTKKKA